MSILCAFVVFKNRKLKVIHVKGFKNATRPTRPSVRGRKLQKGDFAFKLNSASFIILD